MLTKNVIDIIFYMSFVFGVLCQWYVLAMFVFFSYCMLTCFPYMPTLPEVDLTTAFLISSNVFY